MRRRKLGSITTAIEPLLEELIDSHDLQWHEVLALVHAWLVVHRPDAQETYVYDNTKPVYYYGHKDGLTK